MVVERLRKISVPEQFQRENVDDFLTRLLLDEANLSILWVKEITSLLDSDELNKLIDNGKITLGLIKPVLHESVNITDSQISDSEIAHLLSSEISDSLQIILNFSLVLNDEVVNEWYTGGPRERQMKIPPLNPNRYDQEHANRWDEYQSLMTRGPVTVLLLYSEKGNAIEAWRDQIGNHWNVEVVKKEFPNSLRGRYASDLHNNLLHGSDSADAVKREIKLISNYLKNFLPGEGS